MYRLAELVHAAGALDLVAGGEEGGEVPGQAGGFAGDVDDVFYAVCKDLWKSLGVDAVAWGIQDDHVRAMGGDHGQGLLAGADNDGVEAVGGEDHGDKVADGLLILHDQDFVFNLHRFLLSWAGSR